MYKAVIYNTATLKVTKHYKTMSAAKGALTRLSKAKFKERLSKRQTNDGINHLALATIAEYNELNVDVTVYSLMNGTPVTLRKSEVGGPCDPSTERYWSM